MKVLSQSANPKHSALATLNQHHPARCTDLPSALRHILEMSARTLGLDRISIWRFVPDRTALQCYDLFEVSSGTHSSGTLLQAASFPLKPLGTSSVMDVPLQIGGTLGGVISHEHCGPLHTWTEDEQAFALAVANVVSLSFESCERERLEDLLLTQSAALDAAADAIAITDRDGLFEWVNPAFCKLTGFSQSEVIGKNPRQLLRSGLQDQGFYRELWDTLLAGRVWSSEITNRRKDGSTYVERETITPIRSAAGDITHFVAIKRDLTEDRQLQAQFLQAQKMEVVGRLSSGIAHDFNNLLTVINGTCELALADLPAQHPMRIEFEKIADSGKRAAALTRQLLLFSRKQVVKDDPIDIRKVTRDFQSMLQRLIGEDIRLTVECDHSASLVRANISQVEQIILNLAVNARDAMPGGGSLSIRVRDAISEGSSGKGLPGGKRGRVVMLEVSDTGTGMSPETMDRIFEPFFTTKEPGKGTGLGLATVYSIVSNWGGSIWPTSELGSGTTFRILLPLAAPALDNVTGLRQAMAS